LQKTSSIIRIIHHRILLDITQVTQHTPLPDPCFGSTFVDSIASKQMAQITKSHDKIDGFT